MRPHAFFFTLTTAIALAAVAGCAPDTLPPPEGSPNSYSPAAGGPPGSIPPSNHELEQNSAGNHSGVGSSSHFNCDNGQSIIARYPDTEHALITYKNRNRPMHIAVAASGSRYVGHDYEWWTSGSGQNAKGSLFRHQSDGKSGDRVTVCRAQ